MTGFEEFRVKALRGDSDWKNHYVEYGDLKANIISFLNRRTYFSNVISAGSEITEDELDNARLFQPSKVAATIKKRNRKKIQYDNEEDHYHKFADAEDNEFLSNLNLSPKETLKQLAVLDREEFCYVLDIQLEKVGSFYSSQLALFANELTSFKKKVYEQDNSRGVSIEKKHSMSEYLDDKCNFAIPENTKDYVNLGDDLLELFAFVVTNIITLRQILIRYDAYARTVGGAPLTDWYMETRQNDLAIFHNLFQFDTLLSTRVIFTLSVNEVQIQYMRKGEVGAHPSVSYMQDFNLQFDQFKALLEKSHHSVEKSASGKLAFKDHFITTIQDYFLLGSIQRNLNLEPSFLRLRGRHLKKEIETVVKWRKTKESRAEKATDEMNNDYKSIAPENVVPLVLNLSACFLYMMNNYIVEPSSAYYANALGESDALSGILIGAMPMANIGAAVVYSIWTNHSYRQPLFFAGVLIIIGNILYSFAYNNRSVAMCIIGRAITGLGGPRLINRRYVADATPFALRTAASASFAAATSLGAAMGPAAAILLDFFDMKIEMPFELGFVYLNGMTGPGYLMAFLWSIHLCLLGIYFNEPNRVGLEELKQRELYKEQENKQKPRCNSGVTIESVLSEDEGIPGTSITNESTATEIEGSFSCFKYITVPVRICMALIFFKRITLESVMGSTSILTKNRYGWNVKSVGLLQFINGILVIPCSIISGWSSQFYEDRLMTIWLLSIATVAIFSLIDFSDLFGDHDNDTFNDGNFFAVGPVRYILGNFVTFGSIEACESFVASALSKVVPSALASGTFNSGLLTTLVGTSGRTAGDVFITSMGYISLRNLMNLLFVPSFLLMVLMVVMVWRNYEILAV